MVNSHFGKLNPSPVVKDEPLFRGLYLHAELINILEKAIKKYGEMGPVRGAHSKRVKVFAWETIAKLLFAWETICNSMLKDITTVPVSDLSQKNIMKVRKICVDLEEDFGCDIIEMRNICVDLEEDFGCNLKFMTPTIERLEKFLNLANQKEDAEKELAAKKIELEQATQKTKKLQKELDTMKDTVKRLQSEEEVCYKKCSDVTTRVSNSISEIREVVVLDHGATNP